MIPHQQPAEPAQQAAQETARAKGIDMKMEVHPLANGHQPALDARQ